MSKILTSLRSYFRTSVDDDQSGAIPSEVQDKILGCILGQAIGDALGARYEFKSATQANVQVDRDLTDGQHLPILGGGHLKVAPGQPTDDTELALGLARSMLRKGTYDSIDICNSYCNWMQRGGFGIGRTTKQALETALPHRSAKKRLSVVVHNSNELNFESLSNGCLMRISPLAIAGYHWPLDVLLDTGRSNCRLTNPNPIAQDAVASHVAALYAALHCADATEVFNIAFDTAVSDTVRIHLQAAKDGPEPTLLSDGTLVRTYEADRFPTMGYMGIAMQNCYYELLHYESFEKSLVDIMRRGGDTDTNGCIAGALLGAVLGLSQIPPDWVSTVLSANISERVAQNPDANLSDLKELAIGLMAVKPPTPANRALPSSLFGCA